MAKVSVIIPVYNTEKYLRRCLDSVCNQTLKDIEIICVNDCSPDNCLDILREYAERDNRIKLIDFAENKGVSSARNTGIDAATGEYIGFVDSDDFIDLDFYEKLYTKAVETDADAVKGSMKIYDLNTQLAQIQNWIDINDKIKEHKANFYFTFTTAIYRTSLIKENDIHFLENLIHFEDPYFTIKAALFYKKLELIDSACYYYVNNPQSMSRNISIKHATSIVKGANSVLDLLEKHRLDKVHYVIVFNFVYSQLLAWCNLVDGSDNMIKAASRGLADMLLRCEYLQDFFEYHFLEKKKESKINLFKQLREKIKREKQDVA